MEILTLRGNPNDQNAVSAVWRSTAFLVDWGRHGCYNPASSPTYRGVRYLRTHHAVVGPANFSRRSALGFGNKVVAGGKARFVMMEACGLIRGMTSSDSLKAHLFPLYGTQGGSAAVRMARFPIVLPIGAADGSGCNHDELHQAIATRRPGSSGQGRFVESRPTPLTEAS
jgi:hypothetical protein